MNFREENKYKERIIFNHYDKKYLLTIALEFILGHKQIKDKCQRSLTFLNQNVINFSIHTKQLQIALNSL